METKIKVDELGRTIIEDAELLEMISGASGALGDSIPPIVDDCNCNCAH